MRHRQVRRSRGVGTLLTVPGADSMNVSSRREMAMSKPDRMTNFITDRIDGDLKTGKYGGRVVTRFPPEPNGYLHIGHAKSICLNFGLAAQYGGRCHLRFDDTNPTTEDTEYVESIQRDIRWLGFDWGEHLYFASDYFERMYLFAEELIEKGLAYVDSQTLDEVRAGRGTVTEPGTASPYRERSVAENLRLFREMRAGEHPDGSLILRAKIDMSSPNMLMRDPLLYRVRHETHHRTGDDWCIYPMYDFAHCIEDAIEDCTHSICTLEFEINRELYDWVLDNISAPSRPEQIEFARLTLANTITSKRKLLKLVEDGHVSGWDDPRMPTVAGLRRRGVTPESIRAFCDMIGVAKANSLVDFEKFEFCVRSDLNERSPRAMAVLDPLPVEITTLERDESLTGPLWPPDFGRDAEREIPLTRHVVIEREDFAEEAPKGWRRLSPGGEVRLRHGYIVRCDEVLKDDSGAVVGLKCSHDPDSRTSGRKVRGTIQWVSAERGVNAEVRLFDRLFSVEKPGADREFLEDLNSESLVLRKAAMIEPWLADNAAAGQHYQFVRNGFFFVDDDSTEGALVFNRTVTLRDSWTKPEVPAPSRKRTKTKAPTPASAPSRTGERDRARSGDPELAAGLARISAIDGVSASDADYISGDRETLQFFDEACAAGGAPASVAKWLANEVSRYVDDSVSSLRFGARSIAALACLVDDGEISATAGKEVLARMAETGSDPGDIVEAEGLRLIADSGAIEELVDRVFADHELEASRLKEGEKRLLGFFVGAGMRASGGSADAGALRAAILARLG